MRTAEGLRTVRTMSADGGAMSAGGSRSKAVWGVIVAVAALAALSVSPPALATSTTKKFRPRPMPPAVFAVGTETQRHVVASFDGVRLYTETWLPQALPAGPTPPVRLPTILVMSPYSMEGRIWPSYEAARDLLVARGYAFTVMHSRGSGSSEGCSVLGGPEEAHDGAAVIEFLGTTAPWSSGVVGTFGGSYAGMTQLATATGGDPAKTRYLKAMVIGAPNASWYDYLNHDGVPSFGGGPYVTPLYTLNALFPYASGAGVIDDPNEVDYFLQARTSPGGTPVQHYPARLACQPEHYAGANDPSGDVNGWYAAREWREGIENVKAAVLMHHGHLDVNVPPHVQAGLFDRITAPKAGLFGQFPHTVALASVPATETTLPLETSPSRGYRSDYWEMVIAWYDHFLKGIDAGVRSWPVAQVQDSDGVWREEPNWPATGGPVGHLALGAGTLGAEPTGSPTSTYTEVAAPWGRDTRPDGSYVVFDSGPLPERLHVSGVPIVDLWVELDTDDAHIGAELRAFDAEGNPIERKNEAGYWRGGSTVGFRSMRHLDPLVDGRFAQTTGRSAPAGVFETTIRLRPTDLVVPKGGRVTLTIGGMEQWGAFPEPVGEPGRPSLANANVTVHHSCTYMSALRFVMPRATTTRLEVRAPNGAAAKPGESPLTNDGGLATQPRCGQHPRRVQDVFGAARDR